VNLASNIRARERATFDASNEETAVITPALLRAVRERYGNRCVASGVTRETLTVIRLDASRPLSENNAALVSLSAARLLKNAIPAALRAECEAMLLAHSEAEQVELARPQKRLGRSVVYGASGLEGSIGAGEEAKAKAT
jgi:hypothetical protein